MKLIIAGTFKEGDIKQFKVGVDPEPGAVICNATPEQQAAMDAVYAQIAVGRPRRRVRPDRRHGVCAG